MREQDAADAQRLAARARDAAASAFELVSELEAAEVRVDAAASGFGARKRRCRSCRSSSSTTTSCAGSTSGEQGGPGRRRLRAPRRRRRRRRGRAAIVAAATVGEVAAADEAELRAKLGGVAQRALVRTAPSSSPRRACGRTKGDGRRRRPQRARRRRPVVAARSPRRSQDARRQRIVALAHGGGDRTNGKARESEASHRSDVREVAASRQRVYRGAQGRSRARENAPRLRSAPPPTRTPPRRRRPCGDRLPPSEHWLESWDKRRPAQRREEWLPAWPEGSWPKYGWL